jgi:hypothetical protein
MFVLYEIVKVAPNPAVTDSGGTAAVCWLPQELEQSTMAAIARVLRQQETVFLRPLKALDEDGTAITPCCDTFAVEAYSLSTRIAPFGYGSFAGVFSALKALPHLDKVVLVHPSGRLAATREGGAITVTVPAEQTFALEGYKYLIVDALGAPYQALHAAYQERDIIVRFSDESTVVDLPEFILASPDLYSGIVAVAGSNAGLLYRFYQRVGVGEPNVRAGRERILYRQDPGFSSLGKIVPLFARELGIDRITVRPLSFSGGEVTCTLMGEDVAVTLTCLLFAQGFIEPSGLAPQDRI